MEKLGINQLQRMTPIHRKPQTLTRTKYGPLSDSFKTEFWTNPEGWCYSHFLQNGWYEHYLMSFMTLKILSKLKWSQFKNLKGHDVFIYNAQMANKTQSQHVIKECVACTLDSKFIWRNILHSRFIRRIQKKHTFVLMYQSFEWQIHWEKKHL